MTNPLESERMLEAHVRNLGWPEYRIEELTEYVLTGPGSAPFALHILEFASAVRDEMDAALIAQVRPETAWDDEMLAARRRL